MSNLSVVLARQGKAEAEAFGHEAEAFGRNCFETRKQQLGDNHRETFLSMLNLADVLFTRGKLEEAERLFCGALQIQRLQLGSNHFDTLHCKRKLATVLRRRGKLEEAEQHKTAQQILESVIESFDDWKNIVNNGGKTTLRQEVELAVALFVQASSASPEPSNMNQREMVEKVLEIINRTPFDGETLVSWEGVRVGWFLNVFCAASPYMQRLREFGCQAWFVRKVGLIVMMVFTTTDSDCPIDAPPTNDTAATAANDTAVSLVHKLQASRDAVIQKPTLFISYAGAHTWDYMLQSLHRLDPEEVIWLDILSVNQFAWTTDKSRPLSEKEQISRNETRHEFMNDLHKQLETIGRTALMLQKWDNVMGTLGRIWVLWEVFTTSQSDKAKLLVLTTQEQERDFVDNYMEESNGFNLYSEMLAGIDSNTAVAEDPDDRDAIFNRMRATGLTAVNEKVVALMSEWLLLQGLRRLDQRRLESSGPTVQLLANLGLLSHRLGQLERAEQIYRDSIKIGQDQLGNDHVHTLSCMNDLAAVLRDQGKLEEAERLLRTVSEVRQRKLGNQHTDTLFAKCALAEVLGSHGKPREAEALLRDTLKIQQAQLGNRHAHTLTSMSNLSVVLGRQGKLEEAEAFGRSSLEIRKQQLGDSHQDTLLSMLRLASVIFALGKAEEMERLSRDALKIQRLQMGNHHAHTLMSMMNLVNALIMQGNLNEAERLLCEVSQVRQRKLGSQHPDTVSSECLLVTVLQNQGKLGEAEELIRKILKIQQAQLGSHHAHTLATMSNLSVVLARQGKMEEAEAFGHEVEANGRNCFETRKRQLGDNHRETFLSMLNLADVLFARGKIEEVELLFRGALQIQRLQLGSNHPNTLHCMRELATVLRCRGKLEEAEQLEGEHKTVQQTLESINQSFKDWKSIANNGDKTTLRQEVELAVALFVQVYSAFPEPSNMNQREMVEKVLETINHTPFDGATLVSWEGVRVGWFLDVFCGKSQYMQRLREFGCQAWFVRKVGLIVMMLFSVDSSDSKNCFTYASAANDTAVALVHKIAKEWASDKTVVTKPTLFISYTGAHTWDHVVQSLRQLDPDEVIWLDILSVNQFAWTTDKSLPLTEKEKISRKETRDKFMNDLDKQIETIGRTALMLEKWDNVMGTLGQIWVLWEVFVTSRSDKADLQVLVTPEQARHFVDNYMEKKNGFEFYDAMLAGIDAKKADAEDPADRDAIFDRMQETGLFTVNEKVAAMMRSWLLHQGLRRLEQRDLEPSKPSLQLYNNLSTLFDRQGFPLQFSSKRDKIVQDRVRHDLRALSRVCDSKAEELRDQGKLEEAERVYRRCWEFHKYALGNDHPDTLSYANKLSLVLRDQGKLREDEDLEVVAMNDQQVSGYDALHSKNNLATMQNDKGELQQPIAPTLATSMNLLNAFREDNKEEQERVLREILKHRQQELGDQHGVTLWIKCMLADVLGSRGKLGEAEELLRNTLHIQQVQLGHDHIDTLASMEVLAFQLSKQGKYEEAEAFGRDCLEIRKQKLGDRHQETLTIMRILSVVLFELGRLEEAEQYLSHVWLIQRLELGVGHPSTLASFGSLATVLEAQGKLDKADVECLKTGAQAEQQRQGQS